MASKKPLFIQSINPKSVLTILIWLTIAWILSRPLQAVGQNIYGLLGSLTNNIYQSIANTKSTAGELLKSKSIIKKQLQTISLLKIKVNYLENQIKDSDKLKNLLDVKKKLSYKIINASVFGRSPDNWHKQIIINRGTDQQIMLGNSVLSAEGIIGQVVDVNKNTSIVQLISDPAYKLGCKIKRSNILGILVGKTNSIGLVKFIPVGSDIKVGDIVVTSGISSGDLLPTYPKNHPIGRVSKISKKKSKASDLYIEVKLSEGLNSLSDVLVFSPG